MDSIDLFIEHFVIHSESREALVLNVGSSEKFENHLRNLVSQTDRDWETLHRPCSMTLIAIL